jgi:hypothetical protein
MLDDSNEIEFTSEENEDSLEFRVFASVDDELDQILENLNANSYEPSEIPNEIVFEESDQPIKHLTDIRDVEEFGDIQNYSQEERVGKVKIRNLEINLGSEEIFRISCVNHKLNIAIRTAIISHPVV